MGDTDQQIGFVVDWAIKEGHLDAFRDQITSLGAAVQKNEPGALEYNFFLSEDGTTCTLYERYADDDAVLAHFTGEALTSHMGPLMAEASLKGLTVLGTPGDKVQGILANLPVVATLTPAAGFRR